MSEIPVTNWAGNVVYEASARVAPTSVEQVQDAVRAARASGKRLRVVGTRHCFNGIADTDGVHVTLRDLPRRVEVTNEGTAWVDGGITYAEANAALAEHGLALANLASLPHITIAGAIATATHGSGVTQPSLASAVRSLTHVTADGDLRIVRRGDAGFAHYPVHLGLFGPIVELELDVVPAFEIATAVYEGLDYAAAVEHFDALVGDLYSFSLAPNWQDGGRALLFAKRRGGDAAPAEILGARAATSARHPSPSADPVAVTEQLGVAGPSYERLPHFRSEFEPSVGEEVQSEYLVPREHAGAALSALPQFADVFATLAHSMEIRAVAGDDLSLSPMRGADVVAVHITWHRDPDAVMRFLPRLEAALEPFDARPHWGKLYATSRERMLELFPALPEVDAEARGHDPDGMFRNAWSEALFG